MRSPTFRARAGRSGRGKPLAQEGRAPRAGEPSGASFSRRLECSSPCRLPPAAKRRKHRRTEKGSSRAAGPDPCFPLNKSARRAKEAPAGEPVMNHARPRTSIPDNHGTQRWPPASPGSQSNQRTRTRAGKNYLREEGLSQPILRPDESAWASLSVDRGPVLACGTSRGFGRVQRWGARGRMVLSVEALAEGLRWSATSAGPSSTPC